jgi:hypothetical protein
MAYTPAALTCGPKPGFLRSTVFGVLAFALLGQAADIWSSWLVCHDSHVFESNPFTRDANFKFVLSHGCWIKLIWFVFYGLTAAVMYKTCEKYDKRWAAIIASFPLLWFAYEGFQAAVHNCLLISGWFVPGP